MSKREVLVVVETPFRPTTQMSAAMRDRFLEACMRDCIDRGEAPFASHMMYTQILDDEIPSERMLGMRLGFAWGAMAEKVVVYTNLGISDGMRRGIDIARENGKPVEFRELAQFGKPIETTGEVLYGA